MSCPLVTSMSMSRAKQGAERKRGGKAVPILGAAGLSLTLASGASAATEAPAADVNAGVSHEITLSEEEISDVSLATFYVFDKENAGAFRPGVIRLAMGAGCAGCAGCGGCGCVAVISSLQITPVLVSGDVFVWPPAPSGCCCAATGDAAKTSAATSASFFIIRDLILTSACEGTAARPLFSWPVHFLTAR